MKRHFALIALPLALMLGGCSEEPKSTSRKAAEPAKPAEPVSAQSAVFKIYPQAKAWAPDCKLLRVANINISEVKSQGGKSGAWDVTFVSEANQRARRYTYSVVESASSNLHLGVFGGSVDTWTPSTSGGMPKPFLIQNFKKDSIDAFAVAIKKGAEYAQKHPDMPVNFLCEWTSRFPDPAWRVIWGPSISMSNYSIFVDAATGDFLSIAR